MIQTHKVRFLTFVSLLFLAFFCTSGSEVFGSSASHFSNEAYSDTTFQHDEDLIVEQEFNAGKMIMEHVVDNHEWHLATLGHTHITIPLPVILLYDGKVTAFWSSRFHNATHSHKGFILEHGKIHAEGESAKTVYDFSITKTVLAILFS
ncbi:MAG: hypothetical protein ABIK52_08220, partial [Bacteroidota bacterium]